MNCFKFKITFLILAFSVFVTKAQQIRNCGTDEYNANLLSKTPNMMGSEAFELNLKKKVLALDNSGERRAVVRIPVVVHVIHSGEAIGVGRNISDAQVESQIQVINEDFRRLAGTRGFSDDPDSADTEIEFYLARQDPNCNPTSGIDRIDMSSVAETWPFQGITDSVLKPMTIWNPELYVNMWTVQFTDSTLLGYAQLPNSTPSSDGVVMGYTYFGSNDANDVTIGGAFNLGRTTTHELGHYLGLFHTFRGGCSTVNDEVEDTPAIENSTSGCPTVAEDTCTSPGDDMFENYMDYTNDACMSIFTNGQKTRMLNVLSTSRANLLSNTIPDAELPELSVDASIVVESFDDICGEQLPNVKITNFGVTTLTSATIVYAINGGDSNSIDWTGELSQNEFEFIQLPTIASPKGAGTLDVSLSLPITDERDCNNLDSKDFVVSGISVETTQLYFALTTDSFSNETSWEFADGSGTILQSGGPYNGDSDNNTFNEFTFDLETNDCYTLTINDAFGDGICCNFGDGSYELRVDDATGDLLASGGDFGFSESISVFANALSTNEYFLSNDVFLYPNPTKDRITIELGNSIDLPEGYEIVNLLGQSVKRGRIITKEDLSIVITHLKQGVYFVRIINDNTSEAIPFIKE